MNTLFKNLAMVLRRAKAQGFFTEDPPDLPQIAVIIGRVFNFLVLSAGVAFVAMILVSSYKFAMAQGDPKGVEGAKKTLTLALMGFLIVAGVYALLSIAVASLGVAGDYTPAGLIGNISDAISDISDQIGIEF